jgi:hypothetical protein
MLEGDPGSYTTVAEVGEAALCQQAMVEEAATGGVAIDR